MSRTFQVKVTSAGGRVVTTNVEANNIFEAGCTALDRFPSAFCAEVMREVEMEAPGLLRRQAE